MADSRTLRRALTLFALFALVAAFGCARPVRAPRAAQQEEGGRARVEEAERCYEARLGSSPALAGRVTVEYTIDAAGAVSSARLGSSTMGDVAIESCLLDSVRRWRFPPPPGGASVVASYPFVLAPAPIYILGSPRQPGSVEIQLLDDRLFVHQARDPRGIPSNGLVVDTARGLLLVDTAWTDEQTEAVLRWGETALDRRWIGAVVTHDHSDRDGGLAAVLERGIPVQALDLTVERLARRGFRKLTPLLAALDETRTDPRGFEAFYPGPGHAPDNIVLWFPGSGVLFGGCLLKSVDATMLGYTGDADLAAWPVAVRRVIERYPSPSRIIPGHGDVDFAGAIYGHTLDLLEPRPSRQALAR
jgi:metallo-beta-lactamase class B